MDTHHVTWKKVFIGSGFGLIGAVLGMLLAKRAILIFKGTPSWELPALMLGSVALALVAGFIRISVSGRRDRIRGNGKTGL